MYFNFQKQAKDIYAVMDKVDEEYHQTLRILLDEVIYHFLDLHAVPYEKQGEFLNIMFPDCPRAVNDYRTKKF